MPEPKDLSISINYHWNYFLVALSFLLFIVNSCVPSEKSKITESNLSEHQYYWSDSTSVYLPKTEEWTNRVEVGDINNDGMLDIMFANGGNYSNPGDKEYVRVFINMGPGQRMQEITEDIFQDKKHHCRVIKIYDFNKDGISDFVLGTTFESQTQMYFGLGDGIFENVTATHLPAVMASIGDLELGDVDDDGDLDMVLADWGKGSNMTNSGGQTMLWINEGNGKFTDKTAERMPSTLVGFSWDIEYADVDNDYDLDIAISCKRCPGSMVFFNDGNGYFIEKRSIPAYTNNYELEPMDVNSDGYIDFATVNDGEIVNEISYSRREHLFINDSTGRFVDATTRLWPDDSNIGEDDNNIIFLDFESDGDPDFLLSSLTGEDRLLVNDGSGKFSLVQPVLENNNTPHTLSMVVADINGDCKLDIIMGQGEGTEDLEERIFIGTAVQPDAAGPIIANVAVRQDSLSGRWKVLSRIHDHKSPLNAFDFKSVNLLDGKNNLLGAMNWYGEYLWVSHFDNDDSIEEVVIRATDKCDNVTEYRVRL